MAEWLATIRGRRERALFDRRALCLRRACPRRSTPVASTITFCADSRSHRRRASRARPARAELADQERRSRRPMVAPTGPPQQAGRASAIVERLAISVEDDSLTLAPGVPGDGSTPVASTVARVSVRTVGLREDVLAGTRVGAAARGDRPPSHHSRSELRLRPARRAAGRGRRGSSPRVTRTPREASSSAAPAKASTSRSVSSTRAPVQRPSRSTRSAAREEFALVVRMQAA